jgi:hypothetical protein
LAYAGLETRLVEQSAAQDAARVEHGEEVGALCGRLQEKQQLQHAQQAERITKVDQHFTEVCAYMDTKFTEQGGITSPGRVCH